MPIDITRTVNPPTDDLLAPGSPVSASEAPAPGGLALANVAWVVVQAGLLRVRPVPLEDRRVIRRSSGKR